FEQAVIPRGQAIIGRHRRLWKQRFRQIDLHAKAAEIDDAHANPFQVARSNFQVVDLKPESWNSKLLPIANLRVKKRVGKCPAGEITNRCWCSRERLGQS